MFERAHLNRLKIRLLDEPRRFVQVLYGPRQVGKTTLATQLSRENRQALHFVAADAIPASKAHWVSQQWEAARLKLSQSGASAGLLIIDEIQKVENWSEQVKKEWDADTRNNLNLKVLLLGSSRLLLQQGLTESLGGRYETTYAGHWSLSEMEEAFGLSPESYVWFGGYPGAVPLIGEEDRWKQYIRDALIETSISRDILMLTHVDKPALMRRLFELGCAYSGQVLAYSKMIGQLQDAGNTTTLAHYLDLLDTAGLVGGIEKFSTQALRQRASSPKFQVHNTALISAQQPYSQQEIYHQPDRWGRWVESAVGAHLLNHSLQGSFDVYYWRQGNHEVDFVISNGKKTVGLEVKSSDSGSTTGMAAFEKEIHPDKMLLIGNQGLPWQEFLRIHPEELF